MSVQLYGDNQITTIRDLLDEKIGEYLGTFANGEKAIWIQLPIPPEFGQGVHCIINRNARRVGLTSNYDWFVSIIYVASNNESIDETNQTKFDQCLMKIRYWFPRSREVHSTFRGFYPQVNFILNYEREAYNL
jgi:hypothetical protein